MDRRSWLWRRKSSEKTPGETESSGSVSSPSERFSDEQVISSYIKHSPEQTEKLSAALLKISANEELVKQHAKVAEEAVTGWEKAERQLDATVKKNSALEERVSHLDGALKECVRQLRQARDEHERKIDEVVAKRTQQWELRKSELESEVVELRSQLEHAKSESALVDKTVKENRSLRVEIDVLFKKLEARTIERDFSTQAAESASKQRLDSIRKLAKVEGECRKLRLVALRSSDAKKMKEGEPSQFEVRASSSQVAVMDDFLEMEKLAAMEGKGDRTLSQSSTNELDDKIGRLVEEKMKLETALTETQKVSDEALKATKTELRQVQDQLRNSQANLSVIENELIELQAQLIEREDQLNASRSEAKELKSQLIERESSLNSSQLQLNDVENKLVELQMQITERDIKIKASQGHVNDMEARLMEAQTKLRECQNKLKASEEQLQEANKTLVDLQAQLDLTAKTNQDVERERAEAELKVKALESERSSLVAEVEKERALTAEVMAKCQTLEDELSNRTPESDPHLQPPISFKAEKKAEQEKGLAMAAGKLADCQRTIASLGKQLKSLAAIDNFGSESDNLLEFNTDSSVFFRTSEQGNFPCSETQTATTIYPVYSR